MPVYLDYNATTPIAADVLAAMLPYLRDAFGNPSSSHALGRQAKSAVEAARAQVASLIGAQPDEIVFTGGGTEANNLAIRGALLEVPGKPVIVTSTVEHPATDAPCALLAQRGYPLRRIGTMPDGRLDLSEVPRAITAGVGLVSLIHAQNETGILQPVAEVAHAARNAGALIHSDAAQSIGKINVDVEALGVDLLSIAGHKLYAPKGIGALYIRQGTRVAPVLRGAGQEAGYRPGTENVAAIVGLGVACALAAQRLRDGGRARLMQLSQNLLQRLRHEVPGIELVGHPTERLPNTLNVLFPDVSGRQLLEFCPDVLASTGSACHADREDASPALRALGIAEGPALGAVRLSLGHPTTADEIALAASALGAAWRRLRQTHGSKTISV